MLQKSFKGNEKGYKTLNKLSETIHTGMEVLWRQNIMCDVELVTPDRKHIQAHRLVLATCCDYFYDLFIEQSNVSFQVEVLELTGSVLETVLDAMYSGKLKIEVTNVDDLLCAAHTLGMFVIMDACEEFLLEHISRDNCLQILSTAFKYNLNKLTETALQYAANNFQMISRRALFRSLPIEQLIPLLKRNDLDVQSELEVFNRARAWLEEDKMYRMKHAAEVMATIRLPLLTPAEVIDNVESCSYLMEVHACQKLVKESLHYHVMPARQCLLQSPRTVPRLKPETCLVAIGGAPRLKTDSVCDDIIKYNTESKSWEPVTQLPEPRHHHAVAVLNGFLYVAGGESVNFEVAPDNKVFRFDPRNGTWMTVASMANCRQSFQLGVLNGALYAVGGRAGQEESLSSVEKYDPASDRWNEVAPLSSPRRCVAVGCLSGKLYAVGGSGNKVISSRVERYSPTENRWEILKPAITPRFFGHLQCLHNYLFLVGGATIDQNGSVVCVKEIERYSITTNQWTTISMVRTPRSESGCTVLKDKICIVGGYNWNTSERLSDVECLDPETLSWTVLPSMRRPLTGVGAVTLTLYQRRISSAKKLSCAEEKSSS